MHAGIVIFTGLIGTAMAAYIDVETTEIPDSFGITIASVAVLTHLIHGFITGSYHALGYAVVTGVVFAAAGYGLYRVGAWGGADAVLLAATGTLTPSFAAFTPVFDGVWPIAATFFINIWIVGAVYELVYVFILLGSTDAGLPRVSELVSFRSGRFQAVFLVYAAASLSLSLAAAAAFNISFSGLLLRFAVFTPGVIVFVALFNGLKWVENEVMQYTAPVAELQRGDMLAEDVTVDGETFSAAQVRGLERAEVEQLQNAGIDEVVLRTGVSFAPVFPLAILLTVFFGDVVVAAAALL